MISYASSQNRFSLPRYLDRSEQGYTEINQVLRDSVDSKLYVHILLSSQFGSRVVTPALTVVVMSLVIAQHGGEIQWRNPLERVDCPTLSHVKDIIPLTSTGAALHVTTLPGLGFDLEQAPVWSQGRVVFFKRGSSKSSLAC